MAKELTEKQRRFVEAYLTTARGNATEAARAAGYKGSTQVLGSVGAENLKKPQVKAAIDARRQEFGKKADITAEELIYELILIAKANMKDFAAWGMDPLLTAEQIQCLTEAHVEVPQSKRALELDREALAFLKENGHPVTIRRVDLLNSDNLGDEARAVQSISENVNGSVSLKLHDKLAAIRLLAQFKGLLIEKVEHSGKDGKPIEHRNVGLTDATAEALRKKILGVEG